jgi:hypothetical protein
MNEKNKISEVPIACPIKAVPSSIIMPGRPTTERIGKKPASARTIIIILFLASGLIEKLGVNLLLDRL